MKNRIPFLVMAVTITSLTLCPFLASSAHAKYLNSKDDSVAQQQPQGMRVRLSRNIGKSRLKATRQSTDAKANVTTETAKGRESERDRNSDERRNDGQARSCVFTNANINPDPDFDPSTEDDVVNNAVEAFSRNPRSGLLVRVGRYDTEGLGDPFVGGFQQHAIVSNGSFVYAVNPGGDAEVDDGNGTISAFEVQSNCSLRHINTVSSGGRRPVSLALNGNLLYVANAGHSPVQTPEPASYSGFRIRNNGSLRALDCGTVPARSGLGFGSTLADVVFNRSGDVLIATGLLGNYIDSFRVSRAGCLVDRRFYPGGGGPFGALFNPARPRELYVTTAVPELFAGDRAPGVDLYNVRNSGVLTLVDSFTDDDLSDEGLRDPCWLAISPDGQSLWASSFIPNEITLFGIGNGQVNEPLSVYDPGDSTPSPDPNDPRPLRLGSTDIALDPEGRFLYQLNAFDVASMGERPIAPVINVLRVTRNPQRNGGLRRVQTVYLEDDLAFSGIMGLAVVNR
ncbi:MAG: lactonase family protein [Pyrinomonadaceae bacterium MAG19_C2-C3]|nr:lactonase family protein [Pyrinomonadaceae bacterium MAG19_C2-C3]